MASVTWNASKDVRVASDGSGWFAGAGASVALPYGVYQGYTYRSFIGFDHTSIPSNWTKINSAVLWLRNSNQYYIAFGSNPTAYVDLIIEAWTEGTSSALSASNGGGAVYPGPACVSSSPRIVFGPSTTENAWTSRDITSIFNQAIGRGGAFYGIRLMEYSTSSTYVGEVWSTEEGASYDAYIVISYETNTKPNAPTLSAPANAAKIVTATPTLSFTGSDPDVGDTQASYDIQVATDTGFASLVLNQTGQTSGQTGFTVNRVYNGTALVRGTTYYWRARTTDAAGLTGDWSAYRSFTYNALPAIADADRPYAGANHVAPIWNLDDPSATTLTPKPQFTFTPRAVDGETITGYQVEVSLAASPFTVIGTDTVTGTFTQGVAITHQFSFALTNLTAYRVRFIARDALEGYGSWSNYTTFAVKFSQAIYQHNVAGGSGLSFTPGTITGSSAILHRTASLVNGGGTLSAWSDTIPASVPAYLNTLIRLAASGTAPARPSMSTGKWVWSVGTLPLPYSWNGIGGGQFSIDPNARRYGVRSLLFTAPAVAAGSAYQVYQDVPNLSPNTDYAISLWVKVDSYAGNPALSLVAWSGSATIGSQTISRGTTGWERLQATFKTGAGASSVRFIFQIGKEAIAPMVIHMDGAMISEGTVAPVWTPALTGEPVFIDANGLVLDASVGGIFRAEGSSGGDRDLVELASHGLKFGGDVELYSEAAGWLRMKALLAASDAPFIIESGGTARYAGLFLRHGGESFYRFYVQDGTMNWGDGTTTSSDTNLYRAGPSLLKTDDQFAIGPAANKFGETGTGVGLYTSASGAATFKARGILLSTSFADPDPLNNGIQFGADVNLYKSSNAANLLATDDTLWVKGHALVEYGGTPTALSVAVASTYYFVSPAEITFTPLYAGQRWLLVMQVGSMYHSVAAAVSVRTDVTDSANTIIASQMTFARHEGAAVNEYGNGNSSRIWTADAAAARKLRLMATATAAGTLTTGVVVLQAYPLP